MSCDDWIKIGGVQRADSRVWPFFGMHNNGNTFMSMNHFPLILKRKRKNKREKKSMEKEKGCLRVLWANNIAWNVMEQIERQFKEFYSDSRKRSKYEREMRKKSG